MKTPITASHRPFRDPSNEHKQLVEELMKLVGAGQPNPHEFRRVLNTRTVKELRAMIEEAVP